MKKIKCMRLFKILCMSLPFFVFLSCQDDIKGGGEGGGGEDIVIKHKGYGVDYSYPAYVGDVDGEIRDALDDFLLNEVGSFEEATHLVILGRLDEIDSESLRKIYERGTTIAVVYPKLDEFNRYADEHDWFERIVEEEMDKAVLISFNNKNAQHVVYEYESEIVDVPSDADETDEVPSGYDVTADDAYGSGDVTIVHERNESSLLLAGWFIAMNDEYMMPDHAHDDTSESQSISSFFDQQRRGVSYKFNLDDIVVRKAGAYKADTLTGRSGLVTVDYDYRMVHVYEGPAAAGDYYIMNMDAKVNSHNMFSGKEKRVNHGGCVTKICGWLLNDFQVMTTLLDEKGNEIENLTFAPSTSPIPDTEVHKGSHTYGTSFSVGASASVSGGYSLDKGLYAEGQVNASLGWQWDNSYTWDVGEATLKNLCNGTVVGWGLAIDNFPTYTSTGKVSIPVNALLTSNATIKSNWIWYQKNTKDNQIRKPYSLRCEIYLEYFARSHVYSKTKDKYIKLKNTYNVSLDKGIQTNTVGQIEVENDYANDYISNVRIVKADRLDKNIHQDGGSHKPGEKIMLGYFFEKARYKVLFDKIDNGVRQTYLYSLHDSIPIKKAGVTTLHASYDFKPMK